MFGLNSCYESQGDFSIHWSLDLIDVLPNFEEAQESSYQNLLKSSSCCWSIDFRSSFAGVRILFEISSTQEDLIEKSMILTGED